jgi:uncharacterized membrane protein YadS
VVGAAAAYGAEALQVATTVKLTRALWIVPLTLGTAYAFRRRTSPGAGRVVIPWFILFFLLASVIRTYVPAPQITWDVIVRIARIGLTVTLFLIGSALSRKSLAAVGFRPLILGVTLWILVSAAGLWAVRAVV